MTSERVALEDSRPETGEAENPFAPRSRGMGTFRVLGSVERRLEDDELDDLTQRLYWALKHFPELDGRTVTVGWNPESHDWYAEADWDNDIIFLPTHEPCPYQTIYHELAHLAIHQLDLRGADVPPSSEEFCSIFAVARLPPDRLDRSDISYLGTPSVPKEEWPRICRRALAYREDNHNYIQQCKEWLGV